MMSEQKALAMATDLGIAVMVDKVNVWQTWFDMASVPGNTLYRIHRDRRALGKQRVWKVSEVGQGMLLTFSNNTNGQPLFFTRGLAMKFAIDRILKDRELNRVAP